MTYSAIAPTIRKILLDRPNLSTKEVLEILENRNLPPVAQYVYNVRSEMKRERERQQKLIQDRLELRAKTSEVNEKSLADTILDVLYAHPEGLKGRELHDEVLKAGYVSHSTKFMDVVRNKLYDVVESGRISATDLFGQLGKLYRLSVEERHERELREKNDMNKIQQTVPPVTAPIEVPANQPINKVEQPQLPPPVEKVLLDPDILMATIQLAARVDGPKNLQPYLEMLQRIESVPQG